MSRLDSSNIPVHIAIIMDGNRRWARARGLPDVEGHHAGAENLIRIVEAASKLGVKVVTVYALSTENVTERAKREVMGIFGVLKKLYKIEAQKIEKNGIRVNILGEVEGLPKSIQKIVNKLRENYIENESATLNIALNYGGKKELLDAFKKMISEGIDVEKIKEADFEKYLYTKGQKDPELLIRTGGKIRLSNFLLWQTAYSELYFTNKFWPDFTAKDLEKAIEWYQEQQRNFGK